MDFNAYAMMDISKTLYCNAKSVIKGVKLAFKIQCTSCYGSKIVNNYQCICPNGYYTD